MHILCPHCKNPIEVVKISSHEEIECPSCGSSFRLETESTTSWKPKSDQKIGRFELLDKVGKGSFGTVYKARDPELDRIVAIKIPHAGRLSDSEDRGRFLREGRSAAQIRHPSIVSIHEVGEIDDVPYLVSDFVEGVTLTDLLSARRPSPREAAEIIASVADALQYAHEQGVVHRDIKPSNIMIGENNSTHVMDFGLAKRDAGEITMTIDGQILGTPAYMSPEQAKGESHKVDGRSDVYSLGVVLYQLLTGETPFRGTKRMLLHQVLHDEPRPPRRLNDHIPRDLQTICLKAMAKEPGRRYQSATLMAEELTRFLNGHPIQTRPVGRVEKTIRWANRNPVVASLLTTVILVLLGGIAVSTWFGANASRQAEIARQHESKATKNATKLKHKTFELKKTSAELQNSRDELEVTLARSLLYPLGHIKGPLTDPEFEALWELASHKRHRLRDRFLAEALRGRVTIHQLRLRAEPALQAAIGLDQQRRADLEKLLQAKLLDAELAEEHATEAALVASTLVDLSPKTAALAAQVLALSASRTIDPDTLDDLVEGLLKVGKRLNPENKTEAAMALSKAMSMTQDNAAILVLAEGIIGLAPRLSSRNAEGVADTLTTAMKKKHDPFALVAMTRALSALAGCLERNKAHRVCSKAAVRLIQDIDHVQFEEYARAISEIVTRVNANEAAALLSKAISRTKNSFQLVVLARASLDKAAHIDASNATHAYSQTADRLVQALRQIAHRPNKSRYDTSPVLSMLEILFAMTPHLKPDDADRAWSQAALALNNANPPASPSLLPHELITVTANMPHKQKAVVTTALVQAIAKMKQPNAMRYAAEALAAVAAQQESMEANRACRQAANLLVQTMTDTDDTRTLKQLAFGLSAVASRLDSKESRLVCSQATKRLNQAINRITFAPSLQELAEALSSVVANLDSNDADRACSKAASWLIKTIPKTKNSFESGNLASGLSVLAAHLNPKEAYRIRWRAASLLVQAMGKTNSSRELAFFGMKLSALAPHLNEIEAPSVCRPAVDRLADDISSSTNDPDTILKMAQVVSNLVANLKALEAANLLVQTMRKTKSAYALAGLAEGVSAVTHRLDAKEAARVRSQAARIFTLALTNTDDAKTLLGLAAGLPAIIRCIDAKDATQIAVVLSRAVRKSNWGTTSILAKGLSTVVTRMEPDEAAELLIHAMAYVQSDSSRVVLRRSPRRLDEPMAPFSPSTSGLDELSIGLSRVLAQIDDQDLRRRTNTVAAALPMCNNMVGFTLPLLLRPALKPFPCRLRPQQLVNLLKQPTCFGQARRIILDQLEVSFERKFADHWQFVRLARQKHLKLDLTSPPRRRPTEANRQE